jgi:S-DNA-T family DNA segregation ATPase FtsK/SpoIIIE
VNGIVTARERLFLEHGLDSMAAYRAARTRGHLDDGFGDVILVIDGTMVLRQEFEALEQVVGEIAARGLTYGVHVVLTANRWAEVRPALKDLIGTRLELRLGDPADSEVDRRLAVNVPVGSPGRGLTRQKLHFLGALPRIDGASTSHDLAAAAQAFATAAREAWAGPPARPVRMLPERVSYEELPQAGEPRGRLLLGVHEADLEPAYLDLDAEPHLIAFGDSGSGKTGLLRTIAQGVVDRYSPEQARIALVDYRRTMLGTVPESHLLDYSTTATVLGSAVRELVAALERRLPGPDVTAAQLRDRSWWRGPELFVLIDDYDLVTTPSGNPLLPLIDLIPQAKDIGLHVVVVRRSGGAARALYDPLLQRVRELGSPGLLLSGSKEEGALMGTAKPMALPPGRAQLVSRRRGRPEIELVHLAWVTGDAAS